MTTVLLLIHLFVTLALIGVVLIQRSEGGGLGVGTSQGMGSFMSGRGTANLLTRATAVLATMFMLLSLTLALLNRGTSGIGRSILDVPANVGGSMAPGSPVAPGSVSNGATGQANGGSGAGSGAGSDAAGQDARGQGVGPTGTQPAGPGPADAAAPAGRGPAGAGSNGAGSPPAQGPSVPTN